VETQAGSTYWTRVKMQKSSKRWILELIKKVWEVLWDLWIPQDALNMLQASKEQVLQCPLTTKQHWLDSLETAKYWQERAAHDPMAGECKLMEEWEIYQLRKKKKFYYYYMYVSQSTL